MTVEDMWGELPEAVKVMTPTDILEEQAALLAEKTDRLIVGEVETETKDRDFHAVFSLVAPPLGNYSMEILKVSFPLNLYPARMYDQLTNITHDCTTEDVFRDALRSVLTCEEMGRILQSLLNRSYSAK